MYSDSTLTGGGIILVNRFISIIDLGGVSQKHHSTKTISKCIKSITLNGTLSIGTLNSALI